MATRKATRSKRSTRKDGPNLRLIDDTPELAPATACTFFASTGVYRDPRLFAANITVEAGEPELAAWWAWWIQWRGGVMVAVHPQTNRRAFVRYLRSLADEVESRDLPGLDLPSVMKYQEANFWPLPGDPRPGLLRSKAKLRASRARRHGPPEPR